MKHEKKELEGGQIEFSIEIPFEDVKASLEKAAQRISKHLNIPGFRKGKAPYHVVKGQVSAQGILEEAANDIVSGAVTEIIKKENVKSVGMPAIDVQKLAEGNPIQFKAVFDLEPDITLPEIEKIKIKKDEITIDDEKVNQTLERLRSMRAKEVLSNEAIKKEDKAVIDFKVSIQGKEIEGGKAEKYALVVGDGQMIPGFDDELLGLKAGEEKTFELSFPKEYQNKELQGKKATFKVKVHEVFNREKPNIDDEFAKSLGPNFKTLDDYKKNLKESIKKEEENQQKQKKEVEMMEKLHKHVKISHLPKLLLASHKKQMISEFEHSLEHRNKTNLDDYLKITGKTREQFENDMEEQAKKRVKTDLILRAFAEKEDIKVSDEEVSEELEKIKLNFTLAQVSVPEHINSEQYKLYIKNSIRQRKTIEPLAEKIIK